MNNRVIPNVSARLRFVAFMAIIVFSMAACDIGSLPNVSNPSLSITPDEIRLNSSGLTLIVGETETLNTTVLPANVANKAVNWNSSNPQIATVSSNGVVKGVSLGSATIIVTTVDGGKTATCDVSVIEGGATPTSVSIFPPSLTLGVGDTDTLIVTVEPGNADNTVNLKSSNPAVVVVDQTGKITAKSTGTATIYALTVVGGKQASSEVTVNKSIPDTVVAILGHGYNITGRYAHSGYVKSSVLDLDKLLAAQKVKKDLNLRYGEFYTITGNDINEYMRSISADVSYSANASLEKVASFSGQVGYNFDNKLVTKGEYAFATSTSRIVNDAYHIADKSGLEGFFTQSFSNDLVSMSPKQLIEKYGTHVMLGAVLGARIDFNLRTQKRERTSITQLGAYMKASAEATYEDLKMGTDSADKVNAKFEQYFYTIRTVTNTSVVGGKVQYGQFIQNKQEYDSWINSIEGNEVWVDYYPKSLVPISDLVTDKARSDAIAQEIIKYCKEFNVEPWSPISTEYSRLLTGETKFNKSDNGKRDWSINNIFNKDELKSLGYTQLHILLTCTIEQRGLSSGSIRVQIVSSDGKLLEGDTRERNPPFGTPEAFEIDIWRSIESYNSLTVKLTVPNGNSLGTDYIVKDLKITIKAVAVM